MASYGLAPDTVLILSLAGLAAVNLAVFLALGFSTSAVLPSATAALAVLLATQGVEALRGERAAVEDWRGQAQSYLRMLNDYFLVSKADAEGRFCEANENLLRRTGYSLEELASQPLGGLSAGVYSPEYLSAMWSTVQSGQTWSGEFCDRAKDGSLIWVRAIVIPWKNSSGKLEYLTTIGVDVTEQRSAEAELKQAHATLQSFIKHAPAAVAMFDTKMRYVAHTDRWLQDYNLTQTTLVGLGHYDVFPEIPAHWRAKHNRILAGATESCEEERFLRADGSENILRWEVRPWYMPDSSIGGIIMLTEEISERKKLQDKLWSLAKLDSLTGLPNRLLFNETLRDAIVAAVEGGSSLGVALFDLDHFKEINDTLGHDAGDEVLKIIAQRLQNALGGAGTIARLGGDEFAVLILGQGSDDAIYETVADIKTALSEPINLAGTLRACSASIGVTVFPRDATDPRDLLKNADLALYRAKSFGRGRTDLFSPDLRAAIDRKVELQESALGAIQRDEFLLHFQPIVPSDPALPPSFEALLRWRHPVHGLLAPGKFEEIFEDPSVAVAIGDRVMDLALAQASAWQAEGLAFGRVAINVTSADFAFASLSERLQAKLDRYGVLPDKVCIEVTERVILGGGSVHVGDTLLKLDELGVEIALDDFGTGYASLSHIKAFPIGRLKIDRSFVADMQDNTDNLSIVQAIVQLARSLGLGVTAEGVEEETQVALLRSMGCGSLQGYYFSKPQPAEAIRRFLKAKPRRPRVA
ncbi:bifunctional diguanylate cyclase/phosphodiesterase [Hyphomicrobium sp.]|uniref:sensor domain-containing protein n=1 Tax=Hyphomicrobium sp. TaxID=82 RepID=UPI0025C6930A|nr:bifunctional diguanylate cyclase/phosphodiesterase [Hyphomicrobium sp.]MCC7250761.1 EAL domain-containing protein [Hyphomicrobium sp.]